jgi:hypothetical protein
MECFDRSVRIDVIRTTSTSALRTKSTRFMTDRVWGGILHHVSFYKTVFARFECVYDCVRACGHYKHRNSMDADGVDVLDELLHLFIVVWF